MDVQKFQAIVDFIKSLYPKDNPVPLHAPRFLGKEKNYLTECIDTTYVSYVGRFVSEFEESIKRYIGCKHAVAMVNGTAALQMALMAAGVRPGEEVITQVLTFAATAAAIKHAGAEPVFIDVDLDTMGMSPESLQLFLRTYCARRTDGVFNNITGRRISAVVPMHTFGHPVRIHAIQETCIEYGLLLIEDSAESLGSLYRGTHTGRVGKAAILSFNGNKPVTTGGGGMVITDDEGIAEKARHSSTTAKRKHRWEFFHDDIGYNLRMPNLNAAIGCSQMEYLEDTLRNKRETSRLYKTFFHDLGQGFFNEPVESKSNYWLNAILFANRAERDEFLEFSNDNGIQTRPVWTLMSKLPPYSTCMRIDTPNAEWFEDRVVNIPSSVRI